MTHIWIYTKQNLRTDFPHTRIPYPWLLCTVCKEMNNKLRKRKDQMSQKSIIPGCYIFLKGDF